MTVVIRAPARLHLGLLDMNGELGRLYGSIGVAIERPQVLLEAELLKDASGSEGLVVEGLEAERVMTFARRFLERYPLPGEVRLRLRASIPAHVGLGSGTQLALAIGVALARLGGLALNVRDLALVMGRGVHSGIGVAAFQRGGFVVDGGHQVNRNRQALPPVLFRHDFSPEWVFVVAVPEVGPGFSAEREQQAFQALPSAPPALVEKICRLLVIKMLPALMEKEIVPFGQALTEIQRLVGDCFAAVQGGRYANTLSARLIAHFLKRGAYGAGQSSWGPTVYALAEEGEGALALEREARAFLAGQGGGQVFHARADNQGAQQQAKHPLSDQNRNLPLDRTSSL
jgi:beta-ribofuranosylaminobenzene 5'-phosphate synthase